ncbi:glycine-rich domain-containing protein [Escherichia coli]|uniref:glycine-rich domain-containing protein n=1 Tax=Escherichia coli TaxID=562 RepID=UPI00403CF806
MSSAFGKDYQALDATLTALAGLATGANKLPYFTGTDKAAQTDLTKVGRDIIGKNTIDDILAYLGLGDGSGRLIQCQVFKSSGTYTPTKGTKFIIVEIVGGGGAGGGCQVGYPNNAACGGGGMSGEYVKARVDNPTVTTVTIGYGGTGASASVGAPGGTTSFGNTIIAKGGLGGNVLAEGTAPGVVGPYGAYTEPGFTGANIIGSGSGYSSPGVRYSGSLAMGGPGGDSILGAGAGSQAIVGEGINANGHGGGGGGACVYGGATQQRAGGSGMAGIAIIWEYA